MPRKPPQLPDGFRRADVMAGVAYTDLVYPAALHPIGAYIVRWNNGEWYMSAQESDGSADWTDPKAPVPPWYVGPFRSYRAALATLILTITE
jgi:hypothetical protein